ncbi:MAG: hypothetical protein JO190_03660 [Candidatus Eremiobacteraeota bacterium]|nr:hypothetical protein [Candidatus Eremiobacteraeota bacterium]MBV8499313.1 hypothetical protein [Candidatus Eremiobacteraeota bacterium]
MKLSLVAIAAIGAVFFSACGGSGPGAPPASSGASAVGSAPDELTPDDSADASAAAYCRQTGGRVETRRAVYGTTGSKLLFLAGKRTFCQYTKKRNGSRIHILLSTLYTTKPTLAALAYILKPPPSGSCQGNPASCYCSYLGGSDQFGGTTGAGGGWYKKNAIDQTLEACIFPDESSIDSWGLTYHAHGIIRGIDLKKVMRYKYPGG